MLNARLTALLAATIVAVGGGCGDEESTASKQASTTTKPLSEAEFNKRANAACRNENKGLRQRVRTYLKTPRAPVRQVVLNADVAHRVLLATVEAQIATIEDLVEQPGVPQPTIEHVDEMLDFERHDVDNGATTFVYPSPEAVYKEFAGSAELFRKYGLGACANGPKPPIPGGV